MLLYLSIIMAYADVVHLKSTDLPRRYGGDVCGEPIWKYSFELWRGCGSRNQTSNPESIKRILSIYSRKVLSFGNYPVSIKFGEEAGTDLVVKVFGGGQVTNSKLDIGNKNKKFVQSFLMRERIRCIASDLGGVCARKLRFNPTSGRVQLMLIPMFNIDSELEELKPLDENISNVELF